MIDQIQESLRLRLVLAKWGAFAGVLFGLFFLSGLLALGWVNTSRTLSNLFLLFAAMALALVSGHILQMFLRTVYYAEVIAKFLWRRYVPPYTAASFFSDKRTPVTRQSKVANTRLLQSLQAFFLWWVVVLVIGGYLVRAEPIWVTQLSASWPMQILLAATAVLLRLPIAIVEASPFSLPSLDQYQSALFILIAMSIFPAAAVAGAVMQLVEENFLRGLGVPESRNALVEEEDLMNTLVIIAAATGLLAYTVYMFS